MIIRSVDGSNDWQFGKGIQSYLKDQDAVALNIQTRVLSFLNDCFFDQEAGIDWIRLLGSRVIEQEIQLNCRAIIIQSFGVVRVNSIIIDLESKERNLNLTYNIDTIFSTQFEESLEVLV